MYTCIHVYTYMFMYNVLTMNHLFITCSSYQSFLAGYDAINQLVLFSAAFLIVVIIIMIIIIVIIIIITYIYNVHVYCFPNNYEQEKVSQII